MHTLLTGLRHFVVCVVLTILWLSATGASYAKAPVVISSAEVSTAEASAVELSGRRRVNTLPGNLVSYPVLLANTTGSDRRVTIEVDLPSRWSLLMPVAAAEISSGENVNRLLTFRVPHRAHTGVYAVRIRAQDRDTAEPMGDFWLSVEVNAQPDLELSIEDIPEQARAGRPFRVTLVVVNTGNERVLARLEVRTTPFTDAVLGEETVTLDPGEGRRVQVSVSPPLSTSMRKSYRISAVARVDSAPDVLAVASARVVVLSSAMREALNEETVPLSLTLSGVGSRGKHGLQAALQFDGRPFLEREDHLDFLIRVPDRRSHTVFADRDEYRVAFRRERFQVRAGDDAYQLSTLTETGRFGFGAGADVAVGRFSLGGFAERSRQQSIRQSQQGGYVGFQLSETTSLRLNALNRDGLVNGTVATLQASLQPVRGSQLEIEAGTGLRGGGQAATISASGRYPMISYDARWLRTDPEYAGRFGGAKTSQLSAVFTPGTVKLSLSWLDEERRLGRLGQIGREVVGLRRNRALRTEARWNATLLGRSTYLRLNYQNRGYQVLEFATSRAANRKNRFLQIGFGIRLGRLRLATDTQIGRSNSELERGPSRYRTWSLRVSRSGRRLTLGAAASLLDGAIFAGLASQNRVQLSSTVTWQAGRVTRASFQAFSLLDRVESDRSSMSTQVSIDHAVTQSLDVSIRGRRFGYGEDYGRGRAEYSVALKRTLAVARRGKASTRAVRGKLTNGETGAGLSGIWLYLGDQSSRTDTNGHFEFKAVPSGTYYLTYDRLGAGIDLVPLREMPFGIEVAEEDITGVDLALARRGDVAGMASRLAVRNDAPALIVPGFVRETAPLESAGPVRGLIVELTDNLGTVRSVSGVDGALMFSGLRPGLYTVHVWKRSIPEGHRVEAPSTVEVLPGAAVDIPVQVIPQRRELRMVAPPLVARRVRGLVRAAAPDVGRPKD